MPRGRAIKPLKVRFWAKVDKTDYCWNWTGSVDTHGYGQISTPDGVRLCHRVAWTLHRKTNPEGKFVCHKCDNKKCVRPAHLYLGDHQTNMRDRTVRKRHWANQRPEEFSAHMKIVGAMAPPHPGEKNGMARLTAAEAKKIKNSMGRLEDVADQYGISRSHVWSIRVGKAWAHL